MSMELCRVQNYFASPTLRPSISVVFFCGDRRCNKFTSNDGSLMPKKTPSRPNLTVSVVGCPKSQEVNVTKILQEAGFYMGLCMLFVFTRRIWLCYFTQTSTTYIERKHLKRPGRV